MQGQALLGRRELRTGSSCVPGTRTAMGLAGAQFSVPFALGLQATQPLPPAGSGCVRRTSATTAQNPSVLHVTVEKGDLGHCEELHTWPDLPPDTDPGPPGSETRTRLQEAARPLLVPCVLLCSKALICSHWQSTRKEVPGNQDKRKSGSSIRTPPGAAAHWQTPARHSPACPAARVWGRWPEKGRPGLQRRTDCTSLPAFYQSETSRSLINYSQELPCILCCSRCSHFGPRARVLLHSFIRERWAATFLAVRTRVCIS